MNKSDDEKLTVGHYLVAFVDLLGQRDKLKKLEALPSDLNGPEYAEFIQYIKETIGAIYDLQNTTKEFFESYTKNEYPAPFKAIPEFKKSHNSEIKFQHFSDGLVIYVPLRTNDSYSPAKSVYGALIACGMLCLLGLAKKKPVRIGVSIGIAAELNKNEIYGSAVADAYELESFVAQYPRVVVSEEVVNYLLSYAQANCEQNDFVCQMIKKTADSCLKIIARDFDGRAIISYLNDFFRNHLMHGADDQVFSDAISFVEDELEKFQKAQDSKLAFRYAILHGYFYAHFPTLFRKTDKPQA